MISNSNHRIAAQGIALIEVLVALFILGFGVLAIASFEATMNRFSDSAHQRESAVRLAHAKLEQMRDFEQPEHADDRFAWADLQSGSDAAVALGNTNFKRRWSVEGAAVGHQRFVTVSVDWSTRDDATPTTLSLRSMIAASNTADAGAVSVSQPASATFGPARRHPGVPFEASRVHGVGGKSILKWTGERGGYLLIDNASGKVESRCEHQPEDGADLSRLCAPLGAYLLEGYITGDSDAASELSFDGLDAHAEAGHARPECSVEHAVDRNSGAAIAGVARFRCLVHPSDEDNIASTPPSWSGRLRVASADNSLIACRYTADPSSPINSEHPETYTRLEESLDHQNFLLISSGRCPFGTAMQSVD